MRDWTPTRILATAARWFGRGRPWRLSHVSDFFTRLVDDGWASFWACMHNRARLFHVHHKAVYRAILKSATTVHGHLKALKASLGELPVIALEKPGEIAGCKATYRQGHAVATVNRALGVLRAAINWGRFQDPPLLSTTPFHRFGVSIRAREETQRDRRVHRDEEQTLLAACVKMNSAEHKWAGPGMHDRIIGALESCCRQGEMLGMQVGDILCFADIERFAGTAQYVDEPHATTVSSSLAKLKWKRLPFDTSGKVRFE